MRCYCVKIVFKWFEQTLKSFGIRHSGKFMVEKVVDGLQTSETSLIGLLSTACQSRLKLGGGGGSCIWHIILFPFPLHLAFILIDFHSHFRTYGCLSSNNNQNSLRRTLLMRIQNNKWHLAYWHRKHAFWSRFNENRSARFAVVVYFFLARERADLSYFNPVLSDSKTHVYGVNWL